VVTTELKSWIQFHDVITTLLDFPHYIFRGQRMADWLLEPSLARILKGETKPEKIMARHLQTFQLASRGRRGSNPPELKSDNDWWALGQHHGLATPLLDWTTSPYVALFFALADTPGPHQTDHCVIYALNAPRVKEKNDELNMSDPAFGADFICFHPPGDENSRLVAQGGLFSRCPIETDIESWVVKYYPNAGNRAVLFKVLVPFSDRTSCLKSLNVMNINHATLFPDLYGAGKHSTELLRRTIDGRL
jgi:hypothetical protein